MGSGTGKRSGNESDPGSPANAGRDNPEPPTTDPNAEPGSKPDERFAKKAGDLQLEDIKKKINKDVLKRLNMTDAEFQSFAKAYEEMRKRTAPSPQTKEKLATPLQGNAPLPNQGVRKIDAGAVKKTPNLERSGPALPPPEFREAYEEFSRLLSEMDGKKDKK